MNKNKAFPYQICYLIIAALMLVSVIFSLTRGNVTYIIEGLVMIVISLFFAFFTAKEKLTFNGRFELVSDSLEDVISGNP
jgi:integral membrane sensor domain MASE1